MCNLYSLTKGQAAIRDWFRARHDHTGNLPLFPSIFPDQLAPIVRNATNGARSSRERAVFGMDASLALRTVLDPAQHGKPANNPRAPQPQLQSPATIHHSSRRIAST